MQHAAGPTTDTPTQDPSARRLTGILFTGVALSSTAYIAMATLSSIAVDEITGSASLAGVPGAIAVIGTAVGTSLLSVGVARRGRRPGLITGYVLASLGAVAGGLAVVTMSALLLFLAMAFIGLGNAASHLARYTAADMFPVSKRATALAWVVWGSTIGSVAGPTLLGPAGRIAESMGRTELLGGYAIGAAGMGLAALLCFIALRPDPARVALERPTERKIVFSEVTTAFRLPSVRAGLSAMVAGQVVMVMIMTATPLHVHHHGSDLGSVGVVMSAHTLGMFALAPLVGWMADRIGGMRVALLGMAVLAVSAVGAAYGPNESVGGLVVILWLLGIGWNMTFVSGSSMLVTGLDPSIRPRVQGTADSLTWLSSAGSALSAGFLYQAADYRTLGLIGLVLLAVPLVVLVRHRPAPAV